MTAAASPELEIAESDFKNAKIELNESDKNYQNLGARVKMNKFKKDE